VGLGISPHLPDLSRLMKAYLDWQSRTTRKKPKSHYDLKLIFLRIQPTYGSFFFIRYDVPDAFHLALLQESVFRDWALKVDGSLEFTDAVFHFNFSAKLKKIMLRGSK
jgi:hypothetical protein